MATDLRCSESIAGGRSFVVLTGNVDFKRDAAVAKAALNRAGAKAGVP